MLILSDLSNGFSVLILLSMLLILSFLMLKLWQGWCLFEGVISTVTLEVNLAMPLNFGKAGTQQIYY